MARLTADELAGLTELSKAQSALLGLVYPAEWNWRSTVAGMDMTVGRKKILLALAGKGDGEAAVLLASHLARRTVWRPRKGRTAGRPVSPIILADQSVPAVPQVAGLVVYCDGSCDPNPGGWRSYRSAWAAVADGLIVEHGTSVPPDEYDRTNNTAEMWAILHGYRTAGRLWDGRYRILSDSRFCVDAVNNGYRMPNSPHLAAISKLIHSERAKLAGLSTSLEWIPREQNTLADGLSKGTVPAR